MARMGGRPDDENPEISEEQFRQARPLSEVVPAALLSRREVRRRGPQHEPRKVMMTIRVQADVRDAYRASGKGWQTRIGELLAKHVPGRTTKRQAASRRSGTRAKH